MTSCQASDDLPSSSAASSRTEPATIDLSALVSHARQGDQRAFEQLYRATIGRVYGLCLRMTANPSVADDCVQQTYLQAWRNLPGFRGDSSITTWLHQIAVNEIRGHFRREARHDVPQSDEDFPDHAFEGRRTMDLERAISGLPQQARAVFVLVGVYGYPHREAATMLGMAVGTSKAHYHNARRKLRDHLGDSS